MQEHVASLTDSLYCNSTAQSICPIDFPLAIITTDKNKEVFCPVATLNENSYPVTVILYKNVYLQSCKYIHSYVRSYLLIMPFLSITPAPAKVCDKMKGEAKNDRHLKYF